MSKKVLSALLVTLFVIFSISACAKKTVTIGTKTLDASKMYNIYIAQSANKAVLDEMRRGFVIGLKDLGLVEDVNVKYTYENAKSESKYADVITDDINKKKPDLVVAIGDITAVKVFEKCKDAQILFLGCANAERIGFCDASGKPNGNITGVRDSHMIDEQLSFISTNHPNVKKLGIIYNAANPLATYDVDYFKFYATGYDIDIYTVSIKKAADIDKALDSIMPKVDGLALVVDDIVDSELSKVVARCRADGKPVFGKGKENDADGVIVIKDVDMQRVGKEGADKAYDILENGKKASEINVTTVNFD